MMVVQMLLDAKADVNAQCSEYGNAPQAASSGGPHGNTDAARRQRRR